MYNRINQSFYKDRKMYQVQKFDINNALLGDFREFKSYLYADESFFINSDEFFTDNLEIKFFLVSYNGEITTRGCSIINPAIAYKDYHCGLVGYFESKDNSKQAKVLFDGIFNDLKSRGCNYVIGPLNGTTWHHYRVRINTNQKPFFLESYNKSWYSRLFMENGFSVIARYSSFIIKTPSFSSSRISKFENYFSKRGIVVEPISLKRLKEELKQVYELSIKSFRGNFLYSRISFEEFYRLYKNIGNYISPEFFLIAKNQSGKVCGFIFACDNLYNKQSKSLIIKTVAIDPNRYYRGLGTFLTEKIHKLAYENNYHNIIHALMHENNPSIKILSKNSNLYQSYVLYGREL